MFSIPHIVPNKIFELKDLKEIIQRRRQAKFDEIKNLNLKNNRLVINCVLIYLAKISLDIAHNFSTNSNSVEVQKILTGCKLSSSFSYTGNYR